MNIYVFLFSFLPFFVLTCAKLFQDKEGAKLLVVTGNGLGGSSGYFPDSEVVDLGSDIDRNCNGWTEFPFEVVLATGALFNIDSDKETEDMQALLICGGYSWPTEVTSYVASNECYILDKYSSRLFATMTEKRYSAASLITNENKLWVTGGLDFDHDLPAFSSTEYILKNGESVKGPELPHGLAGHTLIGINSTFSMFIGGVIAYDSIDLTYYYDHSNQVWFNGPILNSARSYHGTGIVTDLVTRERLVVVTGGQSYDKQTNDYENYRSTEILLDEKWVLGPNLPRPISAHSMLEYDDSLLLIGGKDYDSHPGQILNSIWSLTCEARICVWTELKQELFVGRYGMVAAIIPDSMTNC